MIAEAFTNIVAIERIKTYHELPSEAPWIVESVLLPTNWPAKGEIEFKNYYFKYRQDLDYVLKDINIVIKGGEKIGVVGRTGAGKSSLTSCLFRYANLPKITSI